MMPSTSSVSFLRPLAATRWLPSALALAMIVASADARTARADSPVGVVLAVGAVTIVAGGGGAALGTALYVWGQRGSTTTTTTTTDKDGNTTSTTTTTQSQSTQRAEAPQVRDHTVAGREYSVDFSLIPSQAQRSERMIPAFPRTRMLQQLDVMLSAENVRSVELVTERAITFEVGRANRSRDDQKLDFDLIVAADALKLSTVDIPETAGYSAFEIIVGEVGAEPLLHARAIVEQGSRPRLSGTPLKFENVKNGQDLLLLKDVVGQARASLGPFETHKQLEMVMRMIGYGERR